MAAKDVGASEFAKGWPVILASMLGIGVGLSPLSFYTLGVLAPPLEHAFGWTISDILAGLTVQTVTVAVLAPLAGLLCNRFGPRRVALCSLLLFSASFMAFALSNGSLWLFYATWGAQAMFGLGTLPITWTRVINQRFDTHRGLALGIAMMGTGLFGFFSKEFTTWLIADFGWRGAYVGLGLLPLLIASPVAYVCFHAPDEAQSDVSAQARADIEAATPGYTLRETFTNWRFWLLAAAVLVISFGIGGPIPNLENILRLHHFSPGVIVELTSLIGLSAMIGRFLGGWLLDLFWAPAVAAFILSLPAISCFLMAQTGLSHFGAAAAIGLIGFSVGVEYDLMAYLVSKYFGMRDYSPIYATIYVCFGVGAGFAPWIFGWSFGQQGSYRPILTVACTMLVLGAVSLLALGRYPDFGGREKRKEGLLF